MAAHEVPIDDVPFARRAKLADHAEPAFFVPAGTRQKRLNAAGELAAHMLGHPDTAPETASALGWR